MSSRMKYVLACGLFLLPPLLALPKTPLGPTGTLFAAMLVMLTLTWLAPLAERHLSSRPWLRTGMAFLFSAILASWMLGPTLKSWWGTADDHLMVLWLGPDGRLTFNEAIHMLKTNEYVGGCLSGPPRMLIGCYTIRIGETWLWGDQPGLWYATNMVVFGLTIFLAWRFLAHYLGSWLGLCATLSLLSYPFWPGVYCRLCAAELWGALGMGLFLNGAAGLLNTSSLTRPTLRHGPITGWLLVALGSALAISSKESFLFMFPLTLGLAFWVWRRRGIGLSGWLLLGLTVLFELFVVIVLAYKLSTAGQDIYSQSMGTNQRLYVAWGGVIRFLAYKRAGMTLLAALLISVWWLRRTRNTARWPAARRDVLYVWLWLAGLFLLYVFTFTAHNGIVYRNSRYYFPMELGPFGAGLALFWLALRVWRSESLHRMWRVLLTAAFVAAVSAQAFEGGLRNLRQMSLKRAAETGALRRLVERTASRLQPDPERPLLIVCHRWVDAEPATAFCRYLRHVGVKNPIYLKPPPRIESHSPLARQVTESLHQISEKGSNPFQAWSSLSASARPLTLGFSGHPDPKLGESLGEAWNMDEGMLASKQR